MLKTNSRPDRRWKRLLLAGLAALWLAPLPQASAEPPAPVRAFVAGHGPDYGLSLDGAGDLCYRKSGEFSAQSAAPAPRLTGAPLERIAGLLKRIAGSPPDRALAPVLAAALRPTLGEGESLAGRPLYEADAEGRKLTALGRNVLMDLLTAEDGADLAVFWQGRETASGVTPAGVLERLKKEGHLLELADSLAHSPSTSGRGVFDGERPVPQVKVSLQRFGRWDELGKAGMKNLYRNPETGNLRLIVAAPAAGASDRFKVLDKEEEAQIASETGLDRELLERHGGRIVRSVDNLVEIDVNPAQAAGLGRDLEKRGISATPNLSVAVGAAAGALSEGRFPLSRLLPLPRRAIAALSEKFRPQSVQAADILKAGALWDAGMEGEGAVVGVIDTGLDRKHPDFQGRTLAYIDLVQGGADAIGHGTHVAGLTLGNGAASGGLYKGMAPKAKLVVIQIFNATGGGASEMSVLAAMKIMSSLPKSLKPDVVNMSLGINPPIGNNLHSSSLLAGYQMVRNNIVMAIAAGNSGPKKYTVGAPGNSRHALTVTGTNKERAIPFFPSRGPVVNWPFQSYNKPDIATVAGDVNRANPCKYAPGGLIAAKSSEENFPMAGGEACNAPGNPKYRYMTGTSMATPLAAGIAADVVGYLKSHGVAYTASEVKALMMETADDLGRPAHEQGAGLVNGEKLASAVKARVAAGAPAGNLALLAASGLGEFERWYLATRRGVVATEAGLLDTGTGHLLRSDSEVGSAAQSVAQELSRKPFWERAKIKLEFALNRGERGGGR